MKLTKENISALQIADDVKTELLSLFDGVTEKETEIASLKTKVPTDSQKVVESVDYEKYTQAVKELGELKKQLAEKLGDTQTEDGDTLLSAFSNFF